MDSSGNDDAWDWVMSPRAENQFSNLDSQTQEQIVSKLDEVVAAEWRHPRDFLEPLTGSPFAKLRVGGYRIGCRIVESDQILRIESIRQRECAYSGDDKFHRGYLISPPRGRRIIDSIQAENTHTGIHFAFSIESPFSPSKEDLGLHDYWIHRSRFGVPRYPSRWR